MSQYLIKNGNAVAHIVGATELKTVSASRVWTYDALNAQYPAVLVNSHKYSVSSAKKYQRIALDDYAKPLAGGRPDDFLIF